MVNPVGGYGKADRGEDMVKRQSRRGDNMEKRGKMVNPVGGLKPFSDRFGGFAALPILPFCATAGFAIFSVAPYRLYQITIPPLNQCAGESMNRG